MVWAAHGVSAAREKGGAGRRGEYGQPPPWFAVIDQATSAASPRRQTVFGPSSSERPSVPWVLPTGKAPLAGCRVLPPPSMPHGEKTGEWPGDFQGIERVQSTIFCVELS